jgi:hypothetical protein
MEMLCIAIHQVPLAEIDFEDQTFQIRQKQVRGSGNKRRANVDTDPHVLRLEPPLVWARQVPYTVVRGFDLLDRLRSMRALSSVERDADDRSVAVRFLEDFCDAPSVTDAIVFAGQGQDGRFDLSTVECARALRRLSNLGCSCKDLDAFLERSCAPLRTAARARLLARSHPVTWEALEGLSISMAHAEVLQRHIERIDRNGKFGQRESEESTTTDASGSVEELLSRLTRDVERHHLWARQLAMRLDAREARSTSSRGSRPRERHTASGNQAIWRLTPRKRCRVYFQDIGCRTPPQVLQRLADAYGELAELIRRWASGE